MPVYEIIVDNVRAVRRQSDDWVNASRVLQIAGRTPKQIQRFIQKDIVKKGVPHEKVSAANLPSTGRVMECWSVSNLLTFACVRLLGLFPEC